MAAVGHGPALLSMEANGALGRTSSFQSEGGSAMSSTVSSSAPPNIGARSRRGTRGMAKKSKRRGAPLVADQRSGMRDLYYSKSEEGGPGVRIAPDAVDRARIVPVVVPRPAARHTYRTIAIPLVSPCTPVVGRALVPRVPAVLDPLPNIAVHVLHAPGVRRKLANRRSLFGSPPAVGSRPSVVDRRPGARGVFPFGLARQPTDLPHPAAQPRDIDLHVLPRDVDHR